MKILFLFLLFFLHTIDASASSRRIEITDELSKRSDHIVIGKITSIVRDETDRRVTCEARPLKIQPKNPDYESKDSQTKKSQSVRPVAIGCRTRKSRNKDNKVTIELEVSEVLYSSAHTMPSKLAISISPHNKDRRFKQITTSDMEETFIFFLKGTQFQTAIQRDFFLPMSMLERVMQSIATTKPQNIAWIGGWIEVCFINEPEHPKAIEILKEALAANYSIERRGVVFYGFTPCGTQSSAPARLLFGVNRAYSLHVGTLGQVGHSGETIALPEFNSEQRFTFYNNAVHVFGHFAGLFHTTEELIHHKKTECTDPDDLAMIDDEITFTNDMRQRHPEIMPHQTNSQSSAMNVCNSNFKTGYLELSEKHKDDLRHMYLGTQLIYGESPTEFDFNVSNSLANQSSETANHPQSESAFLSSLKDNYRRFTGLFKPFPEGITPCIPPPQKSNPLLQLFALTTTLPASSAYCLLSAGLTTSAAALVAERHEQAILFIAANAKSLSQDVAAQRGEYLDALSDLLQVEFAGREELQQSLAANQGFIFMDEHPLSILNRLLEVAHPLIPPPETADVAFKKRELTELSERS